MSIIQHFSFLVHQKTTIRSINNKIFSYIEALKYAENIYRDTADFSLSSDDFKDFFRGPLKDKDYEYL